MAAGEIGRALSLLFEPGQVIEVSAITEEGMASGYFDDPEALAEAVAPLDASRDRRHLRHPERGEPGAPLAAGEPYQDAALEEGRNDR